MRLPPKSSLARMSKCLTQSKQCCSQFFSATGVHTSADRMRSYVLRPHATALFCGAQRTRYVSQTRREMPSANRNKPPHTRTCNQSYDHINAQAPKRPLQILANGNYCHIEPDRKYTKGARSYPHTRLSFTPPQRNPPHRFTQRGVQDVVRYVFEHLTKA